MKSYSKENYLNYKEFENTLVSTLTESFVGHKIVAKEKEFIITGFEFNDTQVNCTWVRFLFINIARKDEATKYVFFPAVDSGALEFQKAQDSALYTQLRYIANEATKIHEAELEEEKAKQAEAYKIAAEQRKLKEAERAKKLAAIEQEKKFKKRIENQLKKLNSLFPEKTIKSFDAPVNFYEALGWMAKHTTSIKPSMPDYMENWFVKNFGDVDDRYVVDSKKRTAGGFQMQWGLSFKMSFDAEVKGQLELRATSKNKRTIDNVTFVWDLIKHYGFKFGKTQDLDEIRDNIPDENLVDFDRGYAM